MARTSKSESIEAIERLHNQIGVGDTVYTVLRHVSRSGLSRSIDLYVMKDGQPERITFNAARAMGETIDRTNGGIKIGGAGMDMGFALVYNLSRVMFPNGHHCIPDARCPSNDHSNGDREYNATKMHRDGGYALQQRWL